MRHCGFPKIASEIFFIGGETSSYVACESTKEEDSWYQMDKETEDHEYGNTKREYVY